MGKRNEEMERRGRGLSERNKKNELKRIETCVANQPGSILSKEGIDIFEGFRINILSR